MCACTSFILLCNIGRSQETAQPRTIPCWQAVSGVISGVTTRDYALHGCVIFYQPHPYGAFPWLWRWGVQFIRRAQSVDNTPSDLNPKCSVKRCVQLSPSSYQPSKRLSKDMPPESFNVDEPQ